MFGISSKRELRVTTCRELRVTTNKLAKQQQQQQQKNGFFSEIKNSQVLSTLFLSIVHYFTDKLA